MPRLKSRTKHPPHDFQLLLPEAGMTQPVRGSFNECVDAFAKIVRKNPALAQKYGWPTDPKGQEDFVDEREAKRLLSHGWSSFVDFSSPVQLPLAGPELKKNWRGVAAAVVSGGRAAFTAYRDMFGPAGPADRELANRRAAVCADCPQNDTEKQLTDYFIEPTAKALMALVGALKDLNVGLDNPEKVGVCRACSCPLVAKTFARIEAIAARMPEDTWQKLPPNCWIKQESKR